MNNQNSPALVGHRPHLNNDQSVPSNSGLPMSNGPGSSASGGSPSHRKIPRAMERHAKKRLVQKLESHNPIYNGTTSTRMESQRYNNASDPQYTSKSALSDDHNPDKAAKYSKTLGSGHSTHSSRSSRSIRTMHILNIPKRRSSLVGSAVRLDIGDGNLSRNSLSHLFLIRKDKNGFERKSLSEPSSSQMSEPPPLLGHQNSDASGSLDSSKAASPGSGQPLTKTRKARTREINNSYAVEGLYCRIRRQLGLKKGPIGRIQSNTDDPASRNSTDVMLDQATGFLHSMVNERRNSGSFATTRSTLSIAAVDDRHHGGLFPRGSSNSASSSLRNIFMGKLHQVTPDPSALYTGSDNEQYFRVQMGSPEAPSFLPSEAKRVGTPPLPSSDSSGNGRRLRGFFFDYRLPDKLSPESPRPAGLQFSPRHAVSPRPQPKHSPAPSEATEKDDWFRMKGRVETSTFRLNVPDHLPSSPLCPRNPKHPSGGKGICVYHGRKKVDTPPISKHTTHESQKSGKGSLGQRSSDVQRAKISDTKHSA